MNTPLNNQQKVISGYQEYLKKLYFRQNRQRTFADFYGYLDRTSGFLTKAILDESIEVTNREFIRPISWLFSMSTFLGVDLEDAFLRKYPGICPYCLLKQCECIKYGKEPPEYIPAYKVIEEREYKYELIRNINEVFSLDDAVKTVKDVFYVNEVIWHYAKAWHHAAKIHEEIAEVHEAYYRYRDNGKPLVSVGDEVADVFAWLLGAWGIVFPKASLDDAVIDYYIAGCPVCKKQKCSCSQFNSRPTGLVNYKLVKDAKEKIQILSDILSDHKDELEELIRSFNVAIEIENEPAALLTIRQAKTKLATCRETAKTQGSRGNQALSIIEDVLTILDKAK
jgi:NTP pyrophosphatase (non-canonical NTP hydrolase)